MKKVGKLFLLLLAISPILSCGDLTKETEKRLNELKNKTESLDSLINKEVDKVLTLDSLIINESDKIKKLDSLVNRTSSRIDSISKEKAKNLEEVLK